jgi:DNA polymerase
MIDNARRLEYLRAIGVDVWVQRGNENLSTQPASATRAEGTEKTRSDASISPQAREIARTKVEPYIVSRDVSVVTELASAELDWPALETAVKTCTQCGLHRTRTQTVFGVGDKQAQWMVIGEAPGADEDAQGEPFVGRAGQLLNSMLKAIGLQREQVFIANVMKCRPPQNRDPTPAEAACCKPYLHRQIELVNPKLILCVGRIAAQNLLNTDTPIGKLRGQVHRLGAAQRPVVVTYHPAYLLRSPGEKRRAWEDLLLAMATMAKI